MKALVSRFVQGGVQESGLAPAFLKNDKVLCASGNALYQVDTESLRQADVKTAAGSKRGISAFATDLTGSTYSYSFREPQPKVHIHDSEGKVIAVLSKGAPDAGLSHLAISECGTLVAGVGAYFERKLVIWDVRSGECICSTPLEEECYAVSFSPIDTTMVCVSGSKTVSFRQIRESAKGFSLVDLSRYSPNLYADSEAQYNGFYGHSWTRDNQVLVVTRGGSLLMMDPHSSIVTKGANSIGQSAARSVACIANAYLVGGADGKVRWIREGSWGEITSVQLADAPITSLALSATAELCAAVSADGALKVFTVDPNAAAEGSDLRQALVLSKGHSGSVLGVAAIYSVSQQMQLLATISQDGKYRVWDFNRSANAAVLETHIADDAEVRAVSIASSPGSPFVAVGTSNGQVLTLLHGRSGLTRASSGACEVEVIPGHSVHAHHNQPVTLLAFDSSGAYLATGCPGESTVCVFSVPRSGDAIRLVAFVELGEHERPVSLAWAEADRLLVAVGDCASSGVKLVSFKTSNLGRDSSDPVRLSNAAVSPVKQASGLCVGDAIILASGALVGGFSGHAGVMDVFDGVTLTHGTDISCEMHESGVARLCRAPQGSSLFAASSVDGAISLWDGAASTPQLLATITEFPRISSALCFSADGKLVAMGQMDGTLAIIAVQDAPAPAVSDFARADSDLRPISKQIANVRQKALAASNSTKQQSGAVLSPPISGQDAQPDAAAALVPTTEYAKWRQRSEDALNVEYERKRSERRAKVQGLQQRLLQLLENNQQSPELERLERDEFVIDVQGRHEHLASNEAASERLRSAILREIKGRELQTKRVKEECIDSMLVHSQHLVGLERGITVRNFPLPVHTKDEQDRFTKVSQLRSVELRELRQAQAAAGSACDSKLWPSRRIAVAVPTSVDWMANAGSLLPTLTFDERGAASEQKSKKEDDAAGGEHNGKEGAEGGKDDQGSGEDGNQAGEAAERAEKSEGGTFPLLDLLYHPAALRSKLQMRSQLVLLSQVQREMMAGFNKRFTSVLEQKEDAADRIASRYERIQEIQQELKQEVEPKPSFFQQSEFAGFNLQVSPEEVGCERYLSKTEREARAKEEEERRRKEEEAAKNNVGARALQDMMNGTLEAAKEQSLADKELEKPAWMDQVPYEEMDEDQKRQLEEFEVALQKFSEEKEKYTKGLELEIKKLKGEIADIMRVFDDQLCELAKLKLDVTENIGLQTLYISHIRRQLHNQEDIDVKMQKLRRTVVENAAKLVKVESLISDFQPKLDQAKSEVHDMTERDKSLEKGLKQALNDQASAANPGDSVEGDLFKALLALYKLRPGRRKALNGDTSPRRESLGLGSARRDSSQGLSARRGSNTTSSPRSAGGEQALDSSRGERRMSNGGMVRRGSSVGRKPSVKNLTADSSESEAGDASAGTRRQDFSLFGTRNAAKDRAEQLYRDREIALVPLNRDTDLPDLFQSQVSAGLWALLQDLRKTKILSELELRSAIENLAKLQTTFDELERQRQSLQEKIHSATKQCTALSIKKRSEAADCEVVLRVKQGSDEVKPGSIITDYSQSLLISRKVIEAENKEIVHLGSAKVGVMNKIKDFRKSINYMQWEHKFRQQQEYDLGEHYTDLHMLRVTKSLQELIKGGESGVSDRQEQMQHAEGQLSRMSKLHSKKVEALRESTAKILASERHLLEENEQLRKRIEQLQTSVELRDAVVKARTGTSLLEEAKDEDRHGSKARSVGGNSAANTKMKSIVKKRRLNDILQAQQDEIAFLQHERERLREKSFPRFANPSAQFAEKNFNRQPDSM